ncbi:C39 family peptidase, partial [Streptomyces sp. NPDC058171]
MAVRIGAAPPKGQIMMSDHFDDTDAWNTDHEPADDPYLDTSVPGGHDDPTDLGRPVDVPADEELGRLHGAPHAATDDWFRQSGDGYCLPASLTEVLAQATGHRFPDESVVTARLAELGMPASANGQPLVDGVTLLDSFGVEAQVQSGLTLTDLEIYLDHGRSLILSVDANDIWYGQEDPIGNPLDKANHALLITGIDQENGVVILSDPGTPDGNAEVVPLAVFEEAWSDGGNQALITTEPTLTTEEITAPGEGLPPTAAPAQAESHPTGPGSVVLPMILNGDPTAPGDETGPVGEPLPGTAHTYTVEAGDTLWDIAEQAYGDGSQYQRIADASGIT